MTLREWADIARVAILHPNGGTVVPVLATDKPTHYRNLYHLSDYAVSSVIAGSVYLVPRPKPSPQGWDFV